jgi:hypothetical protein
VAAAGQGAQVDAVLVEVAHARVGVDRHHGEVEPREGRGGSTTTAMEARRRQGRDGSSVEDDGRGGTAAGRPTTADRRCRGGTAAGIWRFGDLGDLVRGAGWGNASHDKSLQAYPRRFGVNAGGKFTATNRWAQLLFPPVERT